MLKHIASAPTLSPASVRTAAPETPARTQVGLLGSTSVTVLGGSGSAVQPRLSRASSGKLASTGGLASPAGLGPSQGVPRKSLVKNNSEPNLRRKKAVFADEPDDEHSYGQATKGTRYSANAPKARLSVAPKLMRGSTFEVYESEHKADFVVDKSFEKKAAGMATEGPGLGLPASTKIARGYGNVKESMDSWTWMQQADVQERPGLKLKLQRQKINQFFDKNGSSKFPQLSLSLWVQAAARRAPDKLLIIQNTIPAATRRHNAEEAFEKDAEEAAVKKASWEPIHTDIEVCQRKADCVYRPFQGTHKHFLPGGFDEKNLATPRQEQTSEPNSPRSPLSEVSSATTNPLRGERRPTGDGCLRPLAEDAAGANRKMKRSTTLPWSRAEETASGLDWSSNPTQSDLPPPEPELCFYEHQHDPLEQLTLRLAARSSCSWNEELHRLETLKSHIHRHAAARMVWCMRLADTGPPAEGTRPDPVLPYHWAMQRLFDRVKEPLARKGYVRGTVAACTKEDWLRVLDHMCRQRFPGPASSIEEPLAMNLAYANTLPSPPDDTHMLHMLLEVRGMLLEPEVIHVLVVHAPLMNALYSLYARNNEGEMTEEEFLGFCKDFHLCPQLYSEHAVRSLYKSVDCRISVAKPAKPPEPEPAELRRGSRWGLAKNKAMIGVKMQRMFGIGRSSKESTVSRVSAAPSQASELMRTSGAGSKLSDSHASSTQTSLPGAASPSRSPARDRASQAGSSYTSQSQSGADKNRTQDMSASSLRGKRVRNQPAREPTPEPQAPEYYHLFGVHAFMEATLRLMFTYLSFYGNDAQMGMSSYCKVVWSFSYLHYAYSYHKQQIQRRRSKENKLTLEGMTEKVASNNPFAKATRAEFNALRSWLIKKCNSLDTAFETFDIDGSGQVTEQEFSKCLMVLEYTHDPELIGRLWRTFDFDLSGLISEREFMMIRNAVDEDAPTEPASPTSLPPDSPKPPVKRRSRWSAAVEEIVEFDKNYFFRHFPEHEDPPKNPDGRMNLVCGPKMLGGLDETLFTEPPHPPVQLSFRAQMRAKETLGKSLDPLFKPDGTPIAQPEETKEAEEPLPVSIAELMALPGRGTRQRGPAQDSGPPALKVAEAPQDHASVADTASVTSGAGRARGRLRTDSGDMPSPSRSRSKTRTQTEPAKRFPDRESKGSPTRTSPSPGPTPKSRAPLSPKSGATPKSKPKRSPSESKEQPEPKLSDRQRCSLVDVRSVRAKALVWSPLKGSGWGGQPRTLIATGVNERYNQCCLEWADEKHTTVRCLCCARVHHADKSWGNPECCGCSVVDRMDLDATPLAKLLGADIASAVGHAVSVGATDAGAMAGMAESDFAPSVGGDSLLGGASSTAAFGQHGAPFPGAV